MPTDLAHLVGYALPWVEVAIGLLLILGIMVRYSAIFSGIIMVIFIAAIASVWARGLLIDCGCFGGGGQVEPGEANYLTPLLRDAGLAALGIYLFLYPRSKFALDKTPTVVTDSTEKDK